MGALPDTGYARRTRGAPHAGSSPVVLPLSSVSVLAEVFHAPPATLPVSRVVPRGQGCHVEVRPGGAKIPSRRERIWPRAAVFRSGEAHPGRERAYSPRPPA